METLLVQREALTTAVALLTLAIACLFGGIALLRSAMGLFDAVGGTIAPDDPPQELIVTGPYAHVRNPMALAQLMILVAEGLLVGVPEIFVLVGLYVLFLMIYTPCKEEPDLRKRFGADWVHYYYSVGAWLPRCSPWTPGALAQL